MKNKCIYSFPKKVVEWERKNATFLSHPITNQNSFEIEPLPLPLEPLATNFNFAQLSSLQGGYHDSVIPFATPL